ncbi:YozE family protein [Sphingomonas naphthae]|uniref:YozE family protein n=1 Tax=Sphingomonas naphthae TaxID=1813468 RepID=A0ABY7TRW3_9SPHN|nr:YozE family protein [Sphingomonas naphthae]WCT75402.1 YozE family protein [Sphingomonas naphthae]
MVDEPAAVEPPAADSPPFGTWLVGQVQSRSDWIGGLAKSARADPSFPRRGNPDAVRHYLSQRGADGDMFEAIDDAERAWQRS